MYPTFLYQHDVMGVFACFMPNNFVIADSEEIKD